MKILFVTDLYPIGNESIAKALSYFVQEWGKSGHSIDVIRSNFVFNTLIRGRKIKKEGLYIENGIRVYNLNFQTPFFFDVYNKLPKDFSLKNYDVLISHMPCGALLSQRLLEKNKIRYVCSVHSADITVLMDIKYSLYFKNALKKSYLIADKISARSPILKEKIEKIIPAVKDKTFTAFSGIDEEYINEKITPISEKFRISTAASLIKRKNIDVIIKGLSIFTAKDYTFRVMGDGQERKKLEKLTRKLKLSDKIKFTGQISRDEVLKNLEDSDIFILLSNNETFGLCYLEAMAKGNIVIAKNNDGISGIIKDGKNGFLISPNPKELKKCLEKIANTDKDEIQQIKQKAVETTKKYSKQFASNEYLNNIKINV